MSAIGSPAGRKLWVIVKQLGLTDDERHEFTSMFLRKDDPSWQSLNEREVGRLLDALEGFALIAQLYRLRGRR